MADPTNQTTVIGPDTKIKGEMSFDNTAQLLGTFEGKISAKGELKVAKGATCAAEVEAGKVTIDGTVNGNMVGRDRVQLSSSAQMRGDLVAAKLVVEEGAVFVGHCTVGPDAAKQAGNKSGSMTESKSGAPSPTTVRPG